MRPLEARRNASRCVWCATLMLCINARVVQLYWVVGPQNYVKTASCIMDGPTSSQQDSSCAAQAGTTREGWYQRGPVANIPTHARAEHHYPTALDFIPPPRHNTRTNQWAGVPMLCLRQMSCGHLVYQKHTTLLHTILFRELVTAGLSTSASACTHAHPLTHKHTVRQTTIVSPAE